jgi:aldehyde dehydrogenase (NAD+)
MYLSFNFISKLLYKFSMPKLPVFKMFIDGQWQSSSSSQTFEKLNPATERPIGIFQRGSRHDVSDAIESAEKAFDKWSETPAPKRGKIILKAAQLLEKNKENLAKELTEEMGKVLEEAKGDVQEAIDMAEYMAGEGRRLFGKTTTSELKNKFAMTIREPIGIVGCITPWNFPVAIPSWKIFPALVCGNTVVFKPSSDTPRCAIRLVEILEKAGLPKGVLNLVTGSGNTIGDAIVKDKRVRMISFTGHRDTGKDILKKAGIKKVSLELGSKNVVIIMNDADLSLALDGVLWAAFGTTGQRCTAASRVIIQESLKEKFEKMLVAKARKLKVGNGLEKGSQVGPLINRVALEKVHKYTKIGLKEGAKLLLGGKRYGIKGYFYHPTIFTDVSPKMKIAQEEIFGPTTSIIPAKNLDNALEVANSVEYGLSFSIYTKDINKAFEAIKKLQSGIVYVNAPTIGAEIHLPFGGVKSSGFAREGGWGAIEEFSNEKTVYIDYSGKLQRAQIDVD